jgi:predicted nucleotidyltransferase/transcriptional regulator with XRE-family HTH domain
MRLDASKLRALAKSRGLTNTKLAAGAGITRQALQAMLRADQVVDVRERTVRGLIQALQLPDGSFLSPDPLAGYKQAVADEYAQLTFRGLGVPSEPRWLDEVYVPIRVVRVSDREDRHNCRPIATDAAGGPVEQPDRLTIQECLMRHRRVLLRGEPGCGKTTTLRHIARHYARASATAGDSSPSRLPILVRLADFAKACERHGEMSPVRYAVTHTLRDASPEYWVEVERQLESRLQDGTCLVLLDGLDELGGEKEPGERKSLITVIQNFIKAFAQNQFLLTSRVVGLDTGPWTELRFATFEVARWGEEEIDDFSRRWYAGRPALGKKRSTRQPDQRAEALRLREAILGHPPLRDIASNPLMLTILALLHHTNATLPRRRVDLYAKIVEVMLETWEASKREAGPGDPLHGIVLEAREFGWSLARLALAMQREGRILRPRWWVADVIQKFLRDQLALDGDQVKDQTERVISYLCERAGLLVERGDGVFGFYHRTFQEYFAARGLLLEVEGEGDINIVAALRPYIFHPQWEEVVAYTAALLAAPRATALLRVILDDPDPAGRFLRRGQRLALRCLVDGAAVADRNVLEQLLSDGEVIGRSKWLGVPIGFILLLKQLRTTKHDIPARKMLNAIMMAAKEGLSDDEYVTVFTALQNLPPGPKDAPPGYRCRLQLGDREVEMLWPALAMRRANPKAWRGRVVKLIRDRQTDVESRIEFITMLGEEAEFDGTARRVLKELLVRDASEEIRAACAEALAEAAATDSSVATLLVDRLDKEMADTVRDRCATALRDVAPNEREVRNRLEEQLASKSELVRAGAVRGLSRLDFALPDQATLLTDFMSTIASPTEPSRVRCACIWAIVSALGRDDVAGLVEQRLEDADPKVRTAALHVIADAIAAGLRPWSQPLVDRIETMLMAVRHPCPRLYGDLVAIVAMKEIHGSQRLERLLGNALASFNDQVKIAFVFGSVARLEQVRDSDIDLMIIGDVRLKDVAAALRGPEQTVGRTVNPVLYSSERFREQYREGNPFLLDVVRKKKDFVKGDEVELRHLVAERLPE